MWELIFCLVALASPLLVAAYLVSTIWGTKRFLRKSPDADARRARVKQLRRNASRVAALQFATIILLCVSIAHVYDSLAVDFVVTTVMVLWSGAIVIESALCVWADRSLRGLPGRSAHGKLFGVRQFVVLFVVQGLGITLLVFAGIFGAATIVTYYPRFTMSECVSVVLGILLVGYLWFFYVSLPWLLRWYYPSDPVAHPALVEQLDALFRRAGLLPPKYRVIRSTDLALPCAVLTGAKWGRGPWRQALFFGPAVRGLGTAELKALAARAVGRRRLGHDLEAFLLTIGLFIASDWVGGYLLSALDLHFPITAGGLSPLAFLFPGVAVLGINWLLYRSHRAQEDLFAIRLGTTSDDLSSAFLKVAAAREGVAGRSVETTLDSLAREKVSARITELKERAQRKPPFRTGEWLSPLFGKAGALVALVFVVAAGLAWRELAPSAALREAAAEGDLSRVREMLSRGMSVDTFDPRADRRTALAAAAENGQVEVVRYLLDRGATVDLARVPRETPLWRAVKAGQDATATLLLERGANPKIARESSDSMFLVASENGSAGVVEMLLRAGFSMTERNYRGETALLLAAKEGHLEVVRRLAEAGADINERSRHRSTPLLMAAYYNHLEVARYLISRGAELEARDNDGDTALYIAKLHKFGELESVLRSAGAKRDDRVPTSNGKK